MIVSNNLMFLRQSFKQKSLSLSKRSHDYSSYNLNELRNQRSIYQSRRYSRNKYSNLYTNQSTRLRHLSFKQHKNQPKQKVQNKSQIGYSKKCFEGNIRKSSSLNKFSNTSNSYSKPKISFTYHSNNTCLVNDSQNTKKSQNKSWNQYFEDKTNEKIMSNNLNTINKDKKEPQLQFKKVKTKRKSDKQYLEVTVRKSQDKSYIGNLITQNLNSSLQKYTQKKNSVYFDTYMKDKAKQLNNKIYLKSIKNNAGTSTTIIDKCLQIDDHLQSGYNQAPFLKIDKNRISLHKVGCITNINQQKKENQLSYTYTVSQNQISFGNVQSLFDEKQHKKCDTSASEVQASVYR